MMFLNSTWITFVQSFRNHWQECPFQEKLTRELNGLEDVAVVIYGLVGSSALKWIKEPVPALENHRPVDCCMKRSLIKKLKSMLMKMPC